MSVIKKLFRAVLILVLALVLLVGGLLAYLSITEFSPAAVEELEVAGAGSGVAGMDLSVLTWNVGYCGLGSMEDFFMDGGSGVRPSSREAVEAYMSGIVSTLDAVDAGAVMLQEVDTDSKHAYGIDERTALSSGNSVYALNYSCAYVPYPLPETIGKVNCGLLSFSQDEISSAQRISLPCPFSWPLRIANLKRCMMPAYMPVEGSDKQLVLVNVHLEAYDDGEGKAAQTRELISFIESEYAKGNYVIVGGDFNQCFPGSPDVYPNLHGELWTPGLLEESILPEGWRFAYDSDVPTCRLLNQPYDPGDAAGTQYYVIDGFIISPNVELGSVETLDMSFENSDHNPVLLKVTLK